MLICRNFKCKSHTKSESCNLRCLAKGNDRCTFKKYFDEQSEETKKNQKFDVNESTMSIENKKINP